MILTLAQLNPTIAKIEENCVEITKIIEKNPDTELFVFPECALSGYKPLDYLYYDNFFKRQEEALRHVQSSLQDNQACVLGLPTRENLSYDEQRNAEDFGAQYEAFFYPYLNRQTVLYNTALYFNSKKILGAQHKRVLPRNDVFFEPRYFKTGIHTHKFMCGNLSFCILICEDLWTPIVKGMPGHDILLHRPDLILVVSASPYELGKKKKRYWLAEKLVRATGASLLFCNIAGANDEIIFDGSSFMLSSSAALMKELAHCEVDSATLQVQNALGVVEGEAFKKNRIPQVDSIHGERSHSEREPAFPQHLNTRPMVEDHAEDLVTALCMGLRDYLIKSRLPLRAHLGISGGIDSAVVAALACRSLGPKNVCGLLLPSQYTSQQSWEDATLLMQNLGISRQLLSIEQTYDVAMQSLATLFDGKQRDSTEENLQARIRGMLLMAYANKFHSVLLTTGNKSELAVGYATLYGDMCGAINIIGDLFKTEIYGIAAYLNRDRELIPKRILQKAPSAELRENQKDQDTLPPYETLDSILYQFICEFKSPEHLIAQSGFDEKTVRKVWKLYQAAEFKRYQAPPILKVSTRAFGRGRFVPLVAEY